MNPEGASKVETPEAKTERVKVEKEVKKPWEKLSMEEEKKLIEEYEKKGQLDVESKRKIDEILRKEIWEKRIEFAKRWFKDNKERLKDLGKDTETDNLEYILPLIKELNGFEELEKDPRHKDTKEEIENIYTLRKGLERDTLTSDEKFLILNRLDHRKEKIEAELKEAEKKGDLKTASEKKQELEGLVSMRYELAQKIKGQNLREEIENSKTIKEWEEKQGYVYNKENYEVTKCKEELENRRKEIIENEKQKVSKDKTLTDAEKKKKIEEIEKKDYTRELGKKLLGYEIQKKGTILKKFEIVDKSGNRIREFKNEKEANEFLREKIEENLKAKFGNEWETKNQERETLIKELVEEEIKRLASIPEKAEGGIKEVYNRAREKLITEFIEKDLKKEPKSREKLDRIKEEFEREGKDPREFVNEVIHRKGKLENLKGNWIDDEEQIEEFLADWGVPVKSKEKLQEFLKIAEKKGKGYEKMVRRQKGFLEFLIDLIFFLLTSPSATKERS